jgi:predicted RNA-binding Zn-ribbon protein involved in translation (DUF1610 family)
MTTTHGALRNAVNARAHAPCPMCGQDEWAGSDMLACVPESAPSVVSIDVIPFVCRHCGFVRLHAVQALETIDD